MNGGAGIGKQVLGELGSVAKQVVEELGSVVSGSVQDEQADEQVSAGQGDRAQRRAISARLPDGQALGRQQGLRRVREALAEYVAKKKQEDEHEEAVEERQEEVKKDQEEQVRESERDAQIAQAQRSGGGTGEMSRKKG